MPCGVHGPPADRVGGGAGAAGQQSLRHGPADGGEGPECQRHLHRRIRGRQPAEVHDRLLLDLQPHHRADSHPARHVAGQVRGPRLEESPHHAAPQRVPAVQARPAAGGPLTAPAGGDVRSRGGLRAVWGLLRVLARRDDAGVARLHGEGPIQGQYSVSVTFCTMKWESTTE